MKSRLNPIEQRGRSGIALLGWAAWSILLWALWLPVAWFLVNATHLLVTAAEAFPAELGGTAWSYVYTGVLPLVVALPTLGYLGRSRPRQFRTAALVLSLVLGSWFGFYLVKPGEPVIQAVLLAWAGFGLLVPRPPAAPPAGE